jgi:hypothetical protein
MAQNHDENAVLIKNGHSFHHRAFAQHSKQNITANVSVPVAL